MCGGGGDQPEVDTSYQDWSIKQARRARREENQRQARVDEGMRQISAIFEGGRYRPLVDAKGGYDPNAKYFTANGKRWRPDANLTRTKTVRHPGEEGWNGQPARPEDAATTLSGIPQGYAPGTPMKWSWDVNGGQGGLVPAIANAVRTPPAKGWVWDPEGGGGAGDWKATPGADPLKPPKGTIWDPDAGGGAGAYVPQADRPRGPYTTEEEVAVGPGAQYRKMQDKLQMRGNGRKYAGMDPLLDAREKAMRGYYMPALRENYGDAKDELTFALARAGLGVSTAANQKRSKLQQGFRKERAGVQADIARDRAATESSINDQRSSIEAALRSSGDASAAADAALRARSTFAQDQPEMSPLTNTLLGFAQGIGQSVNGYQTGQVRRTAAGGFSDQSRIVS